MSSDSDELARAGVSVDPLRVTVRVSDLHITGYAASEWLEEHHAVISELATDQVGSLKFAWSLIEVHQTLLIMSPCPLALQQAVSHQPGSCDTKGCSQPPALVGPAACSRLHLVCSRWAHAFSL